MIPIIVTLVITMTVDGRDFERHQPMESLPACWEAAQHAMEDIRSAEHKDIILRNIGVGCVIDSGDPA